MRFVKTYTSAHDSGKPPYQYVDAGTVEEICRIASEEGYDLVICRPDSPTRVLLLLANRAIRPRTGIGLPRKQGKRY